MTVVEPALVPAPRPPGRPRDEARERQILQAAFDVLGEVGYDRLTIEAVATRAGAGKATLYRRWKNKAALVVDAVRVAASHDDAWPDTGSLRGDLVDALGQMAAFMDSNEGRVALGLLWAMQKDPDLAATMRTSMLQEKQEACGKVLDRARARGEVHAGNARAAELVPSLMFGLMHVRVTVEGRRADEEWRTHVVDDVLLPVLRA